MKQAQYAQALNFLDALSDRRELAEFSLVQRVKAFFNSYREPEAEAAFAQALPALSKEEGEDIGAWMCAQELQNGCASLDKLPCRAIPDNKEMGEIDFEHSAQALARVMSLECHSESDVDYMTFSEAVHDEDWQTFFRANLKHQRQDDSAAYKLFADVINSNSTPELLRIESVRRLAEFASKSQISRLVDSWKSFESKETWMKSGNLLLTRLLQKEDRENAVRVARDLLNAEALSPAALARLTDMERDAKALREPASASQKIKEDRRTLLDSYEEDP
jgi:hypothetical protein